MSGTAGAVLEHTMSSEAWVEMLINGTPMGEIGLCAGVAGHFGVPFVMVSGDDKACAEAQTLSPGLITAYSVPGGPGVRVDSFVHSDCTVSPYYDSLIAKIITHGRDRTEAIARMRRTLEMTVVEGIKTSIPLHLKILADPDFVAGKFSTSFMERFIQEKPAKTLVESA